MTKQQYLRNIPLKDIKTETNRSKEKCKNFSMINLSAELKKRRKGSVQ